MANRNAALTPPDTPSISLSGSTPSEPENASTAAELVRLASIIDKVVNTNDFDFTSPDAQELLSHIASDFICQIDCIRYPDERLSWESLVAAWRRGAEDDPGVKLAWTSVSSTVDKPKGFAQVFLEKEITAVGGLKFHIMEEQQWRRDFDKWFLFNMIGMRGTPANSGFDSGDMNTALPGMVEQVRTRPISDEAHEKTPSTK
jgi:hypothetical protein